MPRHEIGGVIHRLKKIAAMPPRELAHRARAKGRAELERIGLLKGGPGAPHGEGFKSYLAGAPSHRFYRGLCESEGIPSFVRKNFPQWIDHAVEDADKLCRHEIELLNFPPIDLGSKIDWHRDPVTGRVWERTFWCDYRLENDPAGRDPKLIHELNRHQHLPRLAKAYHLTGKETYAAEAVTQLEAWIAENPPGFGINWQSSLEIGIRAISWLWTLFLLLPSESLDEAAAQRIGNSLFAQLEHIHRYTSLFSSPNTHLIGEATALFIAGLTFRDWRPSAPWLETGAAILAHEAEKQILDDGAYGELSSYYHCYALDFYLQALILAEHNGFRFPELVRSKVGAMLQFLMHLTRPDGTIPLLGDDDGGRALAVCRRTYRSFNDALCIGAVLFLRPDFKHQSKTFFEEALWLLGEEAWEMYRLLKSEPPEETHVFCPHAGYSIQRSGWGPFDHHLVFDFGGLGMSTGGHAHADALSVVLFGEGQELLTDPGTFLYNGAPEWRSYFRSTRAHNTVTTDGHDQAEAGGTFRWKTRMSSRANRYQPRAVRPGFLIDEAAPSKFMPLCIEAEHDGYTRLPEGVTHRRRLVYIPPEYWILVDDLRGSGGHDFEFNFHFGPEVEISAFAHDDTKLALEASGLKLGMFASAPLRMEQMEGCVSRGYGHKASAQVLRASVTASTPVAAMTFLAPSSMQSVLRRIDAGTEMTIACSYEHDGIADIAVLSDGDSEIALGDLRLQGEFFWLRRDGDVILNAVAIRPRSFRREGQNILEDMVCAESAAS
jgi:uncharacterized heparinase superfamily protein